jgi:3-oxoacyl-[acyl-carrier-protein] synthase-3
MNIKARITGLSSYVPEKVLSNADLEKMVDTSDEWIVSRTGIKERRIAKSDEFSSHMGLEASKKALSKAGLNASQLDMILVATMTPDYISPSTAALIQSKLQAKKAGAVDLQAACTGFIYGLSMAKAYVESGTYTQVLVVATEKMSSIVDYKDRNTCVLFGDGAVAAIVSSEGEGLTLDAVVLGSDGDLAELMMIPAGGSKLPATEKTVTQGLHYFKMAGKEVFKHAVRRMGFAAIESLKKANLTKDDISWVVPHQANVRIISAIGTHLSIPDEKIFKTLDRFGNTSGSSVGIALDYLIEEKGLQPKERVLLVAFGVGLTWGSLILTKL